MANVLTIRKGDFVCHERTIENWWGNPIGTEKRAGRVTGNPRDPYTGRYCRADKWCAVVTMKTTMGETMEVELRDLTKIKRLEDFTREDLARLRSEVVLNSDYYHDYRNTFGIDCHSVSMFFDSYLEDITDMAREDGYLWDYAERGSKYYEEGYHTWKEFLKKYDTLDNLVSWWGCYEDFSWVVYEGEEKELREAA